MQESCQFAIFLGIFWWIFLGKCRNSLHFFCAEFAFPERFSDFLRIFSIYFYAMEISYFRRKITISDWKFRAAYRESLAILILGAMFE